MKGTLMRSSMVESRHAQTCGLNADSSAMAELCPVFGTEMEGKVHFELELAGPETLERASKVTNCCYEMGQTHKSFCFYNAEQPLSIPLVVADRPP